jgi:hypothetical protein
MDEEPVAVGFQKLDSALGAAFLLTVMCGLIPAAAQSRRESPSGEGSTAGPSRPVIVRRVRFWSHPGYIRVVVDLEAVVRYKFGRLSHPERLYFDLFDTQISPELPTRQIAVHDDLLNRIRIAQTQDTVTRVVFDLSAGVNQEVFVLTDPPRLVINLKGQSEAGQMAQATPKRSAAPNSALAIASRILKAKPVGAAGAQAEKSTLQPNVPVESRSAGPPAAKPAPQPNAPAESRSAEPAPAPAFEPAIKPVPPAVTPLGVRIPKVNRAPKLEDFLNGRQREAEAVVTDFRQRDPGDGVPASEPTTAYLSYDDENLYVVFVCKDEPGQVRAHMAKREAIDGDDVVSVYIDSYRDRQRAYVFQVNPLGIQRDGVVTEGQNDDYSFDTLWYSQGRLIAEGYIVWMAIPFKSLRFVHSREQTWGVALGRMIVRKNEEAFWPTITRRVEGFVPQLARLDGLAEISPGRNTRFIPYGIFTRARFLDSSIPQIRTQNDRRGGLDSKMVFHDALTLDFSFNPDFSQVESDDPQVTINQRFEVFFPEKRPFFIENAGFFQTPINLFFSRRIADPQFGARLTGKPDGWLLGVLAADDRAPGRAVPAGDPLNGARAKIVVARLKREFGSKSSFGLFFSSRDFGPSWNRIFAFDTRLKLNPNWVLTAQVVDNFDRQTDGTRQSGLGYLADLTHVGRNLVFSSNYTDLSPRFRPELGFIQRVDIRQWTEFGSYRWRPGGKRLLSFGPEVTGVVNWDHRGHLQDWLAEGNFVVEFTRQTELRFGYFEEFLLFQGLDFRQHAADLSFSTDWTKWLSISAGYSKGTSVNFSPSASLPPFLANASGSNFGFTLRPRRQIRLDALYTYSGLATPQGPTFLQTVGAPSVFNNHIARMKLNYQFTRALSVRGIVDYNAILPNPSLVNLNRTKHLGYDFLITYLVHPGTAFYIGYIDHYDNLALDQTVPPSLRFTGSPTFNTGRQFFVKLSYLLLF